MRIFLFILFSFFLTVGNAQEKFLEVSQLLIDNQGEKIKNFEVSITTSENISFVIQAKKKVSYYLPPGEYYIITFSKDNLPSKTIKIDLLNVPENRYDAELQLALKVDLYSTSEMVYAYDKRYGQVIRKVD